MNFDAAAESMAALLREREPLDLVLSNDPGDHICTETAIISQVCGITYAEGIFTFENSTSADFLAKKALVSRAAYDLALKISGAHLIDGRDLPLSLQKFAGGVLSGIRKRPPAPATGWTSPRLFWRNEMIIRYMKALTGPQFKLKPMRNNEKKSGVRDSAADVLAEALTRCGYGMVTADTFMNVWKDKRFRIELDSISRR